MTSGWPNGDLLPQPGPPKGEPRLWSSLAWYEKALAIACTLLAVGGAVWVFGRHRWW